MDIQEKFYKAIKKNDINNVKLLLKNENVNPSKNNNWSIQLASENGHVDIVKLLLKDTRVNPSDSNNWAIQIASENGHFDIVNLLWQVQRVKDTLENDNKELYNELIKNDIKENIEEF